MPPENQVIVINEGGWTDVKNSKSSIPHYTHTDYTVLSNQSPAKLMGEDPSCDAQRKERNDNGIRTLGDQERKNQASGSNKWLGKIPY